MAVFIIPAFAFADAELNFVKNGDAETGTLENWQGFSEVVSEGAHSGMHCFSRRGEQFVCSQELIPIDPAKAYILNGWLKSAGKKRSRVYFGYEPFDAQKRPIAPYQFNCVAGSETVLAEACKAEDTIIKIANGAKWKPVEHARVAFAVDDSGGYKDLPNRNLSTEGITRVENKGDHWEVHLKSGCGLAYPAGTKVREQMSSSRYIFNAALFKLVPNTWTQCTGTIKGQATSQVPVRHDKWWPGTRYVRIILLANYGQTADAELLIDDLSMVERRK